MFAVPAVAEDEHGDGLVDGIHDPVFGNARLGVVGALVDQVTAGIVGTDHLQHQVGAEPVFVAAARVAGMAHQQQIRLAELALTDSQAQRREDRVAAQIPHEREQGEEQESQDHLMSVRRHGQNLDASVSELDQPVTLIRQLQVLGLGPGTLQGGKVGYR